jgi:hypothetical protein
MAGGQMKRYQPVWMDLLVCPKGHQGIYLNGKAFCLECECPIESPSEGEPQEQAKREPRDNEPRDTGSGVHP